MKLLPISSAGRWSDSTERPSEGKGRWTHRLRHRFAEMFGAYKDHNLFKGIETSLVDRWGLAVLGSSKEKSYKRTYYLISDPDKVIQESYEMI